MYRKPIHYELWDTGTELPSDDDIEGRSHVQLQIQNLILKMDD